MVDIQAECTCMWGDREQWVVAQAMQDIAMIAFHCKNAKR